MFSVSVMYSSKWIFLAVFILTNKIKFISSKGLSEDATLNSIGLATKYGHPPTEHKVLTEDGYILTLYRLPGRSRIPVLLTHGILDSSDTWMLRGNTSLAITLANGGYDVWLANFRGNRYSRRHQYLNPDTNHTFWNFSFHEMGYYDLPAFIDTILEKTGANKLTAIGHSQGNTVFYVLGSERKEYNSKIKVMIALAPIAYLHHTPPPLSFFMRLSPLITSLARKLRLHELFGDNSTISISLHKLCSTNDFVNICLEEIFFPIMGFDRAELEPDFARILSVHYPAGTAIGCVLHFLQIGYRKTFARFDYGSKVNKRIYNSPAPPEYSLDRVVMPIAMLTARNDRLSVVSDVAILRRQLPNVVSYIENPRPLFNHVDYMLSRNMPIDLFPYIFRILLEINH